VETIIRIFTILGSFAGFGALYLMYKQYRRNEPKLECNVEKAEYEIVSNKGKNIVRLRGDFIINNSGGASTSVTGCLGFLRLHPDAAKYGVAVIDSQAEENPISVMNFPVKVDAYSSSKVELSFSFKMDYPDFLDRCGVTIDLLNPKKWEWRDLPILAKFVFSHTQGKFETTACVFRADLPESKERRSLDPISRAYAWRDFYPEPRKEH